MLAQGRGRWPVSPERIMIQTNQRKVGANNVKQAISCLQELAISCCFNDGL